MIDIRRVSDVQHMLDMWDFEKNEKEPSEVASTSREQCYWKCKKCGYSWKTRAVSRFRTNGACPCCDRNKVVVKGVNDLFTRYPEAKDSYDFDKNGDVDIDTIGCMSKIIVFWKCPKCNYEWMASVKVRTNSGFKCPCCDSGKVIKRGVNDVFTIVPELKDWYDYEKNDGDRIYQVGLDSRERFRWKCNECGRHWVSSVTARIKKENGQYIVVPCPHYNTMKRKGKEVPFVAAVPSLMKFWDMDKNIRNPNTMHINSNERVFWICSNCGYEWRTSIKFQNEGTGKCMCCELRRVVKKGVSDMLTLLPELKYSYDFEKNKEIDVYSLKVVDYTAVWWKCPDCGYEWKAAVRSRVKGKYGSYSVASCPQCRFDESVIPAFTNENIMKFWDFDKNINLDPQKISVNSDKIAYWKCKKCDYSWSTSIYLRNKTGKCPQCERSNNFKNDIRKGVNDVLTLVPEMKDIYDFENNDDIDIYHTGVGSKTVVWWKCRECGHRWRGAIGGRIHKNEDGSRRLVGCPKCSFYAKRVRYAEKYPMLNEMFDEKRNRVALSEVGPRAAFTIKYWWHCPTCGGSFKRLIGSMTSAIDEGRVCCPYCRGTEALPGVNTLLAKYPDVAKRWSSNNTVSADYVLPHVRTMAKWCCIMCRGEYLAPINEMVRGGVECPYCTNRKALPGFNSLQAKHPTVAEIWSPNNEKTADQVLPNVSTSVMWVCPTCTGEYWAPVNEMVEGIAECPYCINKKVLPGFNSFAVMHKELMKEWDFLNNYLLADADKIGDRCETVVWWRCRNNSSHQYLMSPARRLMFEKRHRESCPYCKGLRRKKRHYI